MSWESCIKGYFFEREGFSTIGSDQGFVTYKDQGDGSFYIRDLYVMPDFRKSNVASAMADVVADLAKAAGAKKLFGTVALLDPECDRNVKILHAYGMRLVGVNPSNQLVFEKEI